MYYTNLYEVVNLWVHVVHPLLVFDKSIQTPNLLILQGVTNALINYVSERDDVFFLMTTSKKQHTNFCLVIFCLSTPTQVAYKLSISHYSLIYSNRCFSIKVWTLPFSLINIYGIFVISTNPTPPPTVKNTATITTTNASLSLSLSLYEWVNIPFFL